MYKVLILFFGLYIFFGLNSMKVEGQNNASACVYVLINKSLSDVAKIQYLNNTIQDNIIDSNNHDNEIIIPSGAGVTINSNIYRLASFSITVGNKNSFFVSLPGHPIYLTNSVNENSVQVRGWQSTSQQENDGGQKNLWKIKIGGFFQIGSTIENQSGVYTGSYPVTFVYN
jgi:hypothetical protein